MMVNRVMSLLCTPPLLPFKRLIDGNNWRREGKLHGIGNTLTGYLVVLCKGVALAPNTSAFRHEPAVTL